MKSKLPKSCCVQAAGKTQASGGFKGVLHFQDVSLFMEVCLLMDLVNNVLDVAFARRWN